MDLAKHQAGYFTCYPIIWADAKLFSKHMLGLELFYALISYLLHIFSDKQSVKYTTLRVHKKVNLQLSKITSRSSKQHCVLFILNFKPLLLMKIASTNF